MAIPGLKVVAPSTPADVVGLMAAAIRDPDPVIFCEHKALFATKGEVPDGEHVVPLGPGRGRPRGRATARSSRSRRWSRGPSRRPSASQADHGIDAEVIDLRTLVPLDVADDPRLGREDEPAVHGRGEPAAAAAGAPRSCRSSPTRASAASTRRSVRITTPHIPLPSASALEDLAIPSVDRIVDDGPDAGWRPRGDRRAGATRSSASSAPAGWARRWRGPCARAGRDAGPLEPRSGDQAEAPWRPSSARASPRPPREACRGRRRRRSRCSPTTTRSARSTAARDGLLAGARAGLGPRRPEHGHARASCGEFAADAAARGVGLLDAPVSGSTATAESGQLTLMVGGDGGGPRARPARPRAAGEGDLPPRAAGHRGRDEARRQHA